MKKYLITLVAIIALIIAIPNVDAKAKKLPKVDHDPINVYIFRGDSCGYCHSALEFFQKNEEKYGDYFNLIGFEVSNQDNASFWQTVGDHFKDEIGGIPYIVIGDAYHATGFEEKMGDKIIATILEQYQNKEYVDVVNNLLVENKLDSKLQTEQNPDFSVLTNASFESVKEEKKSSDIYIVIGIFVVLIGGVTGLVVASKK